MNEQLIRMLCFTLEQIDANAESDCAGKEEVVKLAYKVGALKSAIRMAIEFLE